MKEMGACQHPLHPHGGQKPSFSSPSSTNPAGYFLPRTSGAWLASGFLSLALLHLLCCSPAGTQQAVFSPLLQYFNGTYSSVSPAYVNAAQPTVARLIETVLHLQLRISHGPRLI